MDDATNTTTTIIVLLFIIIVRGGWLLLCESTKSIKMVITWYALQIDVVEILGYNESTKSMRVISLVCINIVFF